eukprot:gene18604-22263_t
MTFGDVNVTMDPSRFRIETSSTSEILNIVIKRYQDLVLFPYGRGGHVADNHLVLTLTVASDNEDLQLGVSENYTLSIDGSSNIAVTADTVYGAMRALETFSQLISYNETADAYSINFTPIMINDFPRFQWRGLMIDPARHYLPKTMIMHILDSMSWSKLNVLHIHLTDGESFTPQSLTFPNLTTEGAFNPLAIYSVEDLEEIVAYGKMVGVRVQAEIDVPGHSMAWTKAFPDIITVCPDYDSDTDHVPFSPASEQTIPIIDGVFNDMIKIFDSNTFHTGGDEVVLDCWGEDPKVIAWMAQNNYTTVQTQQYFTDHFTKTLAAANKTMVIWNDAYANGVTLDPSTIIQVWDSSTLMQDIVDSGFRAIASFDYYLNLMAPSGNSNYYEWIDTYQGMYHSDPQANITTNEHLVIGGETPIWGEQVDIGSIDAFIWPRAIAIAERLWSDREVTYIPTSMTRFTDFICRISARGTAASPIEPDWCLATLMYDQIDFFNPIQRLTTQQIRSILGKQ